MSVLVSREVWRHSRASGNDLAVLLCLAEHVNDAKVKRGDPWQAWPSQSTIAAKCNCSLATVKRSLSRLQQSREIADVGTKAGARGVKIFDVLPLGDVAQDDPAHVELAQTEPCREEASDDLAHPSDDLAHSGDDLAHSVRPPSSPLSYKPEEPERQPEDLEPDARAGARDGQSISSDPGEELREKAETLEELESLLPETGIESARDSLERRISELKGELAEGVPA